MPNAQVNNFKFRLLIINSRILNHEPLKNNPMSQRIIETIGHIEKKENLKSLGYSNMVLESEHPFPGYHGTTVPVQELKI